MKVFSCSQIKQIDAFTIEKEPISSIDLMERAALELMRWIVKFYSSFNPFYIFAGPGNNGGDGIALARMLATVGYDVRLYILKSSNYSTDNQINIDRIKDQKLVNPIFVSNNTDFPEIPADAVIIDSLFGSGISRPLEGIAAELVILLNSFKSKSLIIAIDMPSGLLGEVNPNPNSNPIIQADITLTLQFPKLSFFFPENFRFVGKWFLVNIFLHPQAIDDMATPIYYIDKLDARRLLKKRTKFNHKGNFGHCLIVAGSYGMVGASILSVKSCIEAGAGLVTAQIPRLGYSVLQHSIPEAIVQVDNNDWCFTGVTCTDKFSAIGIGPGLGSESRTVVGFRNLIKQITKPVVIDADGLNILATNPDILDALPKNCILTPHVGEFNRLFGTHFSGSDRLKVAIEMAAKYHVLIVLKGAHSFIACPDGNVFFNSVGNPGMATAGSGDVLTGVITALLGQGYPPIDACILGVYLHGSAGDFAASLYSEHALKASDILNHLGDAFLALDF